MAAWPELDELKQVLNIESEDYDGDESEEALTRLSRVLAAAIDRVKSDTGRVWEEGDEPTDALAQAALRMAELLALKPEVAAGLGSRSVSMASVSGDPVYQKLIYGNRHRFGIG